MPVLAQQALAVPKAELEADALRQVARQQLAAPMGLGKALGARRAGQGL